MSTRKADFAGSWYPGSEWECKDAIKDFIQDSTPCSTAEKGRVGGIVPHAGWYFSGKLACNVVQCLVSDSPPDTFVIFGRHLHPGSGNYIMTEGAWETPLGKLDIDEELAEKLVSEFKFKIETAAHYEQDNTIELQLPFVKYFFPDVKILPIGVPPLIDSLKIGERIVEISKALDKKIMILGSTDLTHYGFNYGFTPKGVGKEAVEWVKNENDKKIIDLMLSMDAQGVIHEALKNYNSCCSGAVATAIASMKQLGADKGEVLAYSSSYDIRPNNSFVGYVGIVF